MKFSLLLGILIQAQMLFGQSYAFEAVERENGTAFFALDTRSGQLYFMLDYSSNAGNWKAYGNPIGHLSGVGFLFSVNSREDGTAFFLMESLTGQVYYMLDYGDNPGVWKMYGEPIGKAGYSFKATGRENGTAFFATETSSGQIYFMLDYGSNAGIWKSYGGKIPR